MGAAYGRRKERAAGRGAGKRTHSAAQEASRARDAEPKAAKPVLGNDPFARGRGAARARAPPVTRVAEEDQGDAATSSASSSTASRPRSTGSSTGSRDVAARAGLAGTAGELREAIAQLLPKMKHALGVAADLARLLEPPERLDRSRARRALPRASAASARAPVRDVVAHGGARDRASPRARRRRSIVANHAGVVPWDALVLRHALQRDHPARRDLRPLLDDREADLPRLRTARDPARRSPRQRRRRPSASCGKAGSSVCSRRGAPSRASPGASVTGSRGSAAAGSRRSRSAPAPRSSRARSSAARRRRRGSRVRAGSLRRSASPPSPRTRSASSAAGFLPLPSRWSLRFGDPIDMGGAGAAAADDAAAVAALTERVRATLQAMLDEEIAARRSVFL